MDAIAKQTLENAAIIGASGVQDVHETYVTLTCPSCGTEHDEEYCPGCGYADPAKTQ